MVDALTKLISIKIHSNLKLEDIQLQKRRLLWRLNPGSRAAAFILPWVPAGLGTTGSVPVKYNVTRRDIYKWGTLYFSEETSTTTLPLSQMRISPQVQMTN